MKIHLFVPLDKQDFSFILLYPQTTKMPVSLPLRFNAGQVSFNEALQKYIPLPTPGEIIVDNSPEGDGCYSFVWRPRDSTSAETEELLVFQGDVIWQKINSCTSGRVYMLAFLSSGAKHLYWMQDVNDEGAMEDGDPLSADSKKDLEIASQMREVLCE